MKVVVVSNRVAQARPDEPIAGGLAAALIPMVKESGAIWVGSSGQTSDVQRKDPFAKIEALGAGALATVDMPAKHYTGYYEGFANSALWPALHSRADLIQVTDDNYTSYREINAFMARALLRFNGPDAVFWVQDYHFLTLGAEMRRLGISRPIGFFLHTPWAERHAMAAVPHQAEIVREMLAYDLIGFQTVEDRQHFEDFLRIELGIMTADGTIATEWGWTQLATFPIGIDVNEFAKRATDAASRGEVSRLRASLQGAKLVLGVDRLDYSKGLANRVRAFDRMLEHEPKLKGSVSMLQVAVPSRGNIKAYRELKNELAGLVSEINGRHGEADWTPIRYLNKGFSQLTLAGFYRTAHVGLVTPLHDGMNLVAKEYVAAQKSARSGRAGAVVVCRRCERARCCAAGQSARHRRDGAKNRTRIDDEPGRASRTLGTDDDEAQACAGAELVYRLSQYALRRPPRAGAAGKSSVLARSRTNRSAALIGQPATGAAAPST